MKTLIAATLLLVFAFPAYAETPYQQGMRDYREGLCYRARPYDDNSPEQKLWERGYDAGAKKYPKRDMSHCHPRNLIKETH